MEIGRARPGGPTDRRLGRSTILDRGHAPYLAALIIAVAAYAVLNSLQDYANYLAGRSLFDLAVYEQGFWNALGNPPFFYSLEGSMSRFGRHFSPVFYLILPFYQLYRDPLTLEVAQSVAIGLGAVPLYFLASERLGKAFAILVALAYLLNPAVHDVNLKNDFHEIAFAMPALLLVVYCARRAATLPYLLALLLALSTREEVSLTTALFGLYLIVFRQDTRRGLLTVAVSLVWAIVVFRWAMPAFNAHNTFPMAPGYEYLGQSIRSVIVGAVRHPGLVIAEAIRPPKLAYLFWLIEPVAFLCLLAPDALGIASIALMIVLASTYPYTYEIFERYAAPIVPFVFFAAIVGTQRVAKLAPRLATGAWPTGLGGLILIATLLSQLTLHKLPSVIQPVPDARTAAVFAIARMLPTTASISADDHRWLAHLADRRELYILSAQSPATDFVMFDRAHQPVTNIPSDELHQVEERALASPDYQVLRCDDGFYLLGRVANPAWNQRFLASLPSPTDFDTRFGPAIYLTRIQPDPAFYPGATASVDLTWYATGTVGSDFHVFVHVVDQAGKLVAQHDGPPDQGFCPTTYWKTGLAVKDAHRIALPANLPPGDYALDIGLYSLQTMQRLPAFDGHGNAIGDQRRTTVDIRPRG